MGISHFLANMHEPLYSFNQHAPFTACKARSFPTHGGLHTQFNHKMATNHALFEFYIHACHAKDNHTGSMHNLYSQAPWLILTGCNFSCTPYLLLIFYSRLTTYKYMCLLVRVYGIPAQVHLQIFIKPHDTF